MTHLFQSIFLFLLLFVPNISQARSVKKQEKPLFVLFHGLGNHAASFTKIKEGLTQAFSADAVVALTSVEGMKSITLSIPQQAEEAFKELSGKVSNLQDRWIFLVGHSQGGLRAYDLLEQYRHALHIKGLITLASPWEGAPGTRVDETMLAAYLTAPVLDDLRRLSVTIDAPSTGLEEQFMCKVAENQRVCLGSGAKDLIADSPFLAKVKKQLPHEQVPILAIGGGASDFGALLAKKKARPFKALNEIYTFFVVGEHPVNRKHDMQVPLYSQHAENIVAKKKKNFTRIFIKDAFHSSHVWSIPVPKDKSILDHPDTVKGIIRFAKRVCK